ncbi:MAG: hypothetical protein L6R36_003759 [Xanthoria steineri]|nr:MAG: hypothetical protein L6R36_003759 [Xanthoria steineri]
MSTATAQPKLKRKSAMLNLFVSPKEINRLKADLQLRQNRRKPPTTTTPAPAAPDPTPTAPPADPTPSAPPPAEPTPPAPWTTAEDIAILHLKGSGKTFAEIATSLAPRTEPEVETRFKEIGLPATITTTITAGEPEPTTDPPAIVTNPEPSKSPTPTTNEPKTKAPKGGGGGGKPKKEKAKPKPAEPTPTPPSSTPLSTTHPFTDPTYPPQSSSSATGGNPTEAILATSHDRKIQGILKRRMPGAYPTITTTTEAETTSNVIPAGATSVNGRPIIYIEENDPLGVEDLSTLYHMHMGFEEQRWIRMASKFFDQTGKRIEPEWLKGKLGGCRL